MFIDSFPHSYQLWLCCRSSQPAFPRSFSCAFSLLPCSCKMDYLINIFVVFLVMRLDSRGLIEKIMRTLLHNFHIRPLSPTLYLHMILTSSIGTAFTVSKMSVPPKRGDLINIPRDVQDEFYRYKMPRLIAKVEGRGNGIKTVVVNMRDIAAALGRPASCTSLLSLLWHISWFWSLFFFFFTL